MTLPMFVLFRLRCTSARRPASCVHRRRSSLRRCRALASSTSRSCISASARLYSFGNTFTNFVRALVPVVEQLAARGGCRSSGGARSSSSCSSASSVSPRCQHCVVPTRALLLGGRQHRLERHHRRVAAARELAVLVVDVGDAAATCRRRSCGRSCRARRPCRRSCTRSRGRRCLRRPRSRPKLRTAKRSPATPRKNASPAIAPYSTVLPMMMFSSRSPRKSMLGRTTMRPPDRPLPT